MSEEKKNEEKDNCPLSPTDWVMLLSEEINRKGGFLYAFQATIWTIVCVFVGAMVGSIYTFINIANDTKFALIVAPSLMKFQLLFLVMIIALIVIAIFVPESAKKKTEPLIRLREKIIFGEEKDCIKIREKWDKIYRTMYSENKIWQEKLI